MDNKRLPRLRRALATRRKIANLRQVSLCVYRSNSHIYVQVYSPERNQVLTQASSAEKNLRGGKGGNVETARKVGELIAQRCLEKGITQAVFDRSGYKYHGRVKALAEAAREKGLKI